MISGRGLGHTAGDPGQAGIHPGVPDPAGSPERFVALLQRSGLAMGRTDRRSRARDRKLYALRDVTGTVESIP